jgi:outer membrane protein W
MKVSNIIALAVALFIGTSALAQEQNGRITPVRVGVALTAGSNSHIGITAQNGMLTSYQTEAASVDWTDKALGLGIEGSLIFCDRWKLDLGGSFSFWNNPSYPMVPGTMDGGYEPGEIPTYEAVDMQHKLNWIAYIAGSYYFRICAVPALRPYVGVRFSGSYASSSTRVDNYEAMGMSAAEGFVLSGGVLTGVDYYFSRNFFVGASVEPFRYSYGVTAYRPQEGLSRLGADTHFLGAFAAPQLKIGFLF